MKEVLGTHEQCRAESIVLNFCFVLVFFREFKECNKKTFFLVKTIKIFEL